MRYEHARAAPCCICAFPKCGKFRTSVGEFFALVTPLIFNFCSVLFFDTPVCSSDTVDRRGIALFREERAAVIVLNRAIIERVTPMAAVYIVNRTANFSARWLNYGALPNLERNIQMRTCAPHERFVVVAWVIRVRARLAAKLCARSKSAIVTCVYCDAPLCLRRYIASALSLYRSRLIQNCRWIFNETHDGGKTLYFMKLFFITRYLRIFLKRWKKISNTS